MSALDFDSLLNSEELTLEDILAIEASGSEKGIYKRDALDFIHSGKLGVPYKFSSKNAQSVKMGFTSALKAILEDETVSAEDKEVAKVLEVRVRKTEKTKNPDGTDAPQQEFVFLINQYKVAQARGANPAPVATDNGGSSEDETSTDTE